MQIKCSYLSLDAYKKCSLTRLIFSSGIFLSIDGSLCNKTSEGSHCWTLPPYTHPVKITIQTHALICQAGHSDARQVGMDQGSYKRTLKGKRKNRMLWKSPGYLFNQKGLLPKKADMQQAILGNFNLPKDTLCFSFHPNKSPSEADVTLHFKMKV